MNLTFELTYWRWGLETAQKWRERLGLPRDERMGPRTRAAVAAVRRRREIPVCRNAHRQYTNRRWRNDHPAVLGAFGMLPGPGIDQPTMRRTFDWVWDELELARHVGLGLSARWR